MPSVKIPTAHTEQYGSYRDVSQRLSLSTQESARAAKAVRLLDECKAVLQRYVAMSVANSAFVIPWTGRTFSTPAGRTHCINDANHLILNGAVIHSLKIPYLTAP